MTKAFHIQGFIVVLTVTLRLRRNRTPLGDKAPRLREAGLPCSAR